MDDVSKELIGAATSELLRPLTKVIEDGVGALGGDRLAEFREERQERRRERRAKLGHETKKLLEARGVEQVAEPTETSVEEILNAAQDENRPELQKLWAALLAAALDPRRAKVFRADFIEIAKKLEPIEALILPLLADNTPKKPNRLNWVVSKLGVSNDQVEISFVALNNLGLTDGGHISENTPYHTALGRQFMIAIES